MVRSLLLTILLLSLGAVLSASRAQAQQVYTPSSLAALLLTQSEMAVVVEATGLPYTFTTSADTDPSTDPVVVGRVFLADDQSLLSVSLASFGDGTAPMGEDRDIILNGEFVRIVTGSIFSSINGFTVGPSIVGDGQDVTVTFTGVRSGTSYNVVADSFIHGNIFGVIFFAATGEGDLLMVAATLGGQTAKLP